MAPLIFIAGLLLALIGTGAIIPWLKSRQILDLPNERSSHSHPTIRGAGLVLVGSIVIMFLFIEWDLVKIDSLTNLPIIFYVLIAVIFLALISWLDDLYGLSIVLRLLIQFLTVASVIAVDHERVNFFPTFMPWWICFFFLIGFCCWFTNIYNFMDGVDGITGVETISICLGIIIISAVNGWVSLGQDYALALAGVSLGFLWWNWQPARIFLGDVGSIPLGFLLAWLLFGLAAKGFYLQAIILPLYYLIDATLTIVIRLFSGKKIWDAHRDHFYQRAVQGGLSHSRVSLTVALLNGLLIGFSVLALYFPVISLSVAVISTLITIIYFGTRKSVGI